MSEPMLGSLGDELEKPSPWTRGLDSWPTSPKMLTGEVLRCMWFDGAQRYAQQGIYDFGGCLSAFAHVLDAQLTSLQFNGELAARQ